MRHLVAVIQLIARILVHPRHMKNQVGLLQLYHFQNFILFLKSSLLNPYGVNQAIFNKSNRNDVSCGLGPDLESPISFHTRTNAKPQTTQY